MTLLILSVVAFLFAALPTAMVLANLRRYRPPPLTCDAPEGMSILIPARNEEATLAAALEAALRTQGVPFEVLVLDDHSTDRTAEIVRGFMVKDARVQLLSAPELPAGWCGKQHACQVLADHASFDWLIFIDADVRLAPTALVRMLAFMQQSGADLGSGFPRQQTGTLLEKLMIPVIHFLLLGFLPMGRMRQFPTTPAYAAGCGQLFIAKRKSYQQMGGHAAIKASLHDGIKLPRAFRAVGLKTDLFDATTLAVCRMYTSGRDLWRGFGKNATEGMARSLLSLLIWTLLLASGQILPVILYTVVGSYPSGEWEGKQPLQAMVTTVLSFLALACCYLPRFVMVGRFQQSVLGALLHPVGILLVLLLQWESWAKQKLGLKAAWKGRSYGGG